MSATGRTDFISIENAALDFSQLEDYINDDGDGGESIFNNGSNYFTDALVNPEIKLPESPESGAKRTDYGYSHDNGQQRTLPNSISRNGIRNHSVSNGVNPHPPEYPHDSSTHLNNSDNNHQRPAHQHPNHQHHRNIQLYDKVTNPSSSHPHHLPESPPDSGSEPPYSPMNENENRAVHNNHPNNNSTHQTLHQSSPPGVICKQNNSGDMMHPGHYGSAQIKHLSPSELNLPLNPSNIHPSQDIRHLGHINPLHPIVGSLPHHADEQMIAHLSESILVNQINMHGPIHHEPGPNVPGQPIHLGALYQPHIAQQVVENYHAPRPISTSGSSPVIQKKRKISGSPGKNVPSNDNSPGVDDSSSIQIKPEPTMDGSSVQLNSMEEDYGFDYGTGPDGPSSLYLDSAYQCIRFQPFQQTSWHTLCDAATKELPVPNYRVDADKGFNFSNADDAFVCQKKNHFQVTVHVQPVGEPVFVKTCDGLKKVDNFYLHFYGVKVESPTQTIKVEQSQSDRSKKPFYPVLVELNPDQVSKTTVGRLHFGETTSNNMRKKGKPNPDQRYFYLVVSLFAHVADQTYPIISHSSERIIVRASNPGQFENDMELSWQKGHTPESIYHAGRVGINTDRPDESLVVHGNIKVTGHIVQPSDSRAKTNVEEIDPKEQLRNVSSIRVVRYQFTPEFAKQVGIKEEDITGTGVIAQEVQQVIPDAVKEEDDVILPNGKKIEKLLVVNKDRLFMENVGAVKELCKVTDNLGTRLDELERVNNKLRKINRFDSIKSMLSTSTNSSAVTCSVTSYPEYNKKMVSRIPSDTSKQSGKHKNFGDKNEICTNRLMQTIIMILVFVMAFCLISIFTIYLLEAPRSHHQLLNALTHQAQSVHGTSLFGNSVHNKSSQSLSSSPTSHHSSSSPNSFSNHISSSVDHRETNQPQNEDLSHGSAEGDNSVNQGTHKYLNNRRESVGERQAIIPIMIPYEIGVPDECEIRDLSTLPHQTSHSSSSCPVYCCVSGSHSQENIQHHLLDYQEMKTGEQPKPEDRKMENNSKDSESLMRKPALDSNLEPEKVTGPTRSSPSLIVTPSTSGLRGNMLNDHSPEDILSVSSQDSAISSTPFSSSQHGEKSSEENLQAEKQKNESSGGQNNETHLSGEQIMSKNAYHFSSVDQQIDNKVQLNEPQLGTNKYEASQIGTREAEIHSRYLSSTDHPRKDEHRHKRAAVEDSSKHSVSDVQSVTRNERTRQGRQYKSRPSSAYMSGLVTSLKLLELNVTIDYNFCTDRLCVSDVGPSFNYRVPISKYMPHEYVTLQFSLESPSKVDHCIHQEKPVGCPSASLDSVPHIYHRSEEHSPIRESNPKFRIPIGIYFQSTYVFRILAKDKDADTPCSLPPRDIGSSFLEYKFTFNRQCNK